MIGSYFSVLLKRLDESNVIVNRHHLLPTVIPSVRRGMKAPNNIYTVEEHIFIKAVMPWLFNKKHIELHLYQRNNPLETDAGLELLKSISKDAVVRIKVCRIVNIMPLTKKKQFQAIFATCEQLKSLIVNPYNGALGFKYATQANAKLRRFVCFNAFPPSEAIRDISSESLIGLKDITVSFIISGRAAWTEFVSSLKNMVSLTILINADITWLLENFENIRNLHHLRLQYRQKNCTPETDFSGRTMPVLISLSIMYRAIMWHELADACPCLLNLELQLCKVTINAGCANALCLNSLLWREFDWITDNQCERQSLLHQMSNCALRTVTIVGRPEYLTKVVRELMKNPARLVGCIVILLVGQTDVDRLVFRTNRCDRIRMYLLKACTVSNEVI